VVGTVTEPKNVSGATISFHGLLIFDSQVRCVPITDIFVCNDHEVTRDREPLYAAFHAATVLLNSISEDAKKLKLQPVAIPSHHRRFPDVKSLCDFGDVNGQKRIYFQIVKSLADVTTATTTTDCLLYIAQKQDSDGTTTDGTTILVKFSQKYGKELHSFSAEKGFAPKLLGFECLPGGWLGIAMEYFSSASSIVDSPLVYNLQDIWIQEMKTIVTELHNNGYVHGDLRLPNFIVDGKRLLLVEFDWGGECDKATFPDARLHPILRSNRQERLITKGHDKKVLVDTIECIKHRDCVRE
jgi:hypothetical protein